MKKTVIFVCAIVLSACATHELDDNPYAKLSSGGNRQFVDRQCEPLLEPTTEVKPCILVNPGYPTQAINEKLEGHIKMMFDIDKQGQAFNIEVLESVPKGVFDVAALKAFKRWTFRTLKQKEQLVTQTGQVYTMQFQLQN